MSDEPRTESATSVDFWCSKCGNLTKDTESREPIREGTRIRYDHVGQCPSSRANEWNYGKKEKH